MKRLCLAALVSVSMLFSGCDTIKAVSNSLGMSEWEMAAGLKEALTNGLFKGFDAFANPNQGNALLRFAFPGDAAKIEKTLRDLGMTQLVNNVTAKYTNAMSQAVQKAKPMFVSAVKNMSIRDAASILLTQNNTAATEYFKTQMTPQLMTAFKPIVDSTVRSSGAGTEYQTLAKAYNALSSQKLETNLNDFIAARAIDGMFLYVANEEKNIRSNLQYRTSDLLKRVFGYADQQLKGSSISN
ncbi:MAG: DUF4197 domain-containing protein [Niabella sp.]